MIGKEDYAVIKSLDQRGIYLKDIAAELGVHPRTVSRAIKRGSAPRRERKERNSKLDRYKEQVDELLSKGVWNTMVILREIQADGYDGGTTILKEYVQPKRALRPGKATVRFETRPGEQLQSDWGEVIVEIAGKATKVHFIGLLTAVPFLVHGQRRC
jgi:transposase